MTSADVIAGARGKPEPCEVLGYTYLLRPITRAELLAWFAWREEQNGKPNLGFAMQAKLLAMVVCDDSGKPVLSEEQVVELPNAAIEMLCDEVARRNWGTEGKAPSVMTPA